MQWWFLGDRMAIDDPYEIPLHPDVTCFSDRESIDESVSKIVNALDKSLNIA